ncbi:hypothetical protein ScPMuIL_004816 [Solemya velum]
MTTEKHSKIGGEQTLTVALRVRPMNEDEILMSSSIAHKVDDNMVILLDPMEDPDDILRANRSREKHFMFDYSFDSNSTQESVYEATTKILIGNVINGYNATVFAYGATGAGKTYTMLGMDDDPGIMARALNDLFLEMEKTSEDMAYKVTMSYLEIYNEMIRDLLQPSSGILDLREDAKGGVQVAGLSEVMARSTVEVMDVLLKGNKQRTQEPTSANKTSSRSHAVLQVTVKQQNRVRNVMQEVRVGKLFLVDLAGSERAANTLNRGKRMVEGAHINRSLLALGNCINALSDKNGSKYVNFRDSKLTRLLKDALWGNCKTVMIAHISPASAHFEESRNTLVYADRAKHIKTKVRRNVTDVSFHIAQYTNIITELREEIMRLRHRLHDRTPVKPPGRVNIQSVHSEVLEAKLNADKEELNKLKEQLLISFADQMELRKSLMELNNSSMEVSLETNRNQMIISEWESERVKAVQRHNTGDNLLTDSEKALELSGAGSDDIPETEEVRVARDELKVLHDEKHKTEKIRTTVHKELDLAKQKTRKLEELIPQKINIEDHREILSLLVKVHELEITNTEVQTSCLLRDFQIKKKDMVIARHRQQQHICDQIIKRQRRIISENNLPCPKALEDLLELYNKERDERQLHRDDSDHLNLDQFRSKVPSTNGSRLNLPGETEPLDTLQEESEPAMSRKNTQRNSRSINPGDKLFDQTPSSAWQGDMEEEMDHLQLAPSRLSQEDRNTILSNTRSIVALAAKKRSKVQNNKLNFEKQASDHKTLHSSSNNMKYSGDTDIYLSTNTLAKHNTKFIEAPVSLPSLNKFPSEDNISIGTKLSTNTDSTLPPIRQEDKNAVPRRIPPERDLKRMKRSRAYESSYQYPYGKPVPRSRFGFENGKSDSSIRDYEANTPGVRWPSRRHYRGQGSDSSAVSTPQNKNRKGIPTIPRYRKGDITVTGFGLPRY